MFKRVLVSLDLSPATESLVASLPGLADLGTREIVLAHVVKHDGEFVSQSISMADEARRRLRTLAERLSERGFDVSVDVVGGGPATEICRLAREREADVILVGTRSHSRVYEAFVGSVAWEIVRRAHRPVLMQRIEPSRSDPESALEVRNSTLPDRVVHASDFSPTAQRALPLLEHLAALGVPAFTLVHALPEEADGREQAVTRLEELAGRLRAAGAPQVDVEVRRGSAADLVLGLGGRNHHSMVVIGTQGRGLLPEIVLGSQSREVVRQATARVLLVPPAEGEN